MPQEYKVVSGNVYSGGVSAGAKYGGGLEVHGIIGDVEWAAECGFSEDEEVIRERMVFQTVETVGGILGALAHR